VLPARHLARHAANEGQVTAAENAERLAAHEPPASRRSWALFAAALMLAYFGTSVALFAPVQNVLPRLIESAAGSAHKAVYLGLVTGLGAVAALVFNPLSGYFSDRWVTADNRSTIVALGLVTGGLSLSLLGTQRSIAGLAICWTLCQASINIAYSSMSASIYDHVPRRDWGFAGGLIAVAQSVGLIVGFAVVVLVFPEATPGMIAVTCIYAVFLVPLVVVLRRLPRVEHTGIPGRSARESVRVLLRGGTGFTTVWIGEFLVTLANSIALLYLYYYLQDVIRYPKPGNGQLILVAVATGAAIVATVTVGRLADRSASYKRYAIFATTLLALTGFVLAVISSWGPAIACAVALGAGYGAFQSVTQALGMRVLPDRSSAARDLGIINVATAIPQVIGPSVAAVVIATGAGYRGLFAFAGLLALAAAAVYTRVPA
jgi:MFS family permease